MFTLLLKTQQRKKCSFTRKRETQKGKKSSRRQPQCKGGVSAQTSSSAMWVSRWICFIALTTIWKNMTKMQRFTKAVKHLYRPWRKHTKTQSFTPTHNGVPPPTPPHLTHKHTQTHTHPAQAPKGKCRFINISPLQPKTVSLCWFFWALKFALGAEMVPTPFFYAVQQVCWGKERCIHPAARVD